MKANFIDSYRRKPLSFQDSSVTLFHHTVCMSSQLHDCLAEPTLLACALLLEISTLVILRPPLTPVYSRGQIGGTLSHYMNQFGIA